ncbi:hypothetical protein PVAND_006556 [Polypedilum vanderplanki]|uniref:Uncharacterized protein n=1 Tax=Polypedilum vanderplanki TaxID=319348 RepID=A0A9J6C4J9_POLVA|nr:hypothetical protein PVAND_006556 [Polypedilum vanderplanki]
MPLRHDFAVVKTEYNLSEEDSNSSNSPTMVETTSPLLKARALSPTPRLSPQSHNFLSTKMLLTPHNLSYFHAQRNSINENQKSSEILCNSDKHTSSSTSIFTIDSILSKQTRFSERSPSTSPINDNLFNKNEPVSTTNRSTTTTTTRLPPALFQHHPAAAGLHITTHLASNFGSPEVLR